MKILATILIIAALLWCVVPRSSADLNAWNDGQNANITISNLVSKGTMVLTNSITNSVAVTINQAANSSVNTIEVTRGGTSHLTLSSAAALFVGGSYSQNGSTMSIQSASGNLNINSGSTVISSETSGVTQLGADAASVVTPQTLKAADGTGTDHNGAALQLQAGQSTGSGVPGDLIYRTSLYTNGSGSTANAYTVRGQVVGRPCALTNATATSFQRFTMATNTQVGIKLFCTVKATDAAFARQSISSDVRVDAVNVNGTITATLSETDNTLAASTGTLTIAYTVVDEGSNVLAIRANANTSLTATPSIKWVIQSINSDGAITVTPVQL